MELDRRPSSCQVATASATSSSESAVAVSRVTGMRPFNAHGPDRRATQVFAA